MSPYLEKLLPALNDKGWNVKIIEKQERICTKVSWKKIYKEVKIKYLVFDNREKIND